MHQIACAATSSVRAIGGSELGDSRNMSSCGLLFVFIYSSAAVFMIVSGQSTTDDSQNDVSLVEQLVHTVASLRTEVQKLKARQSSMTLDNRKLFFIILCFAVCAGNNRLTVRNFPSAAASGGGFWRAAKTGGRRCTPVTFGRQPAQVFSRPRRRTQSVLTQRRNF